MFKSYPRSDRVSDVLHREICRLLFKEVKDPRLGFITVTGVEVSRDLKLAKVFYTLLGSPDQAQESSRAYSALPRSSKSSWAKYCTCDPFLI